MQVFERWLVAACDALACGVLALMGTVIFIEVLSRSLLGFSTNVAEEVASLSLIVMLFLGLPGAFSRNALIRVDILYRSFGSWFLVVVDRLFCLVAVAVSGVYAWYLFDTARSSLRFGFRTDSALGIPVYLPQLTMVFGVTALAAVALAALLRRPQAPEQESGVGREVTDGA